MANHKTQAARLARAKRSMLAVAIAAFAAAAPVMASDDTQQDDASEQQAGTGGVKQLESVTVTATRDARDVRDVPLSITALDQTRMDDMGIRKVDDVVRLTPNISLDRVARYNATQSNISIRGIKSNSGTATTGIYLNDTPVQIRGGTSQSATNAYPMVFDLERVEVLRGPQGTLFGTSSMGGAVRFITPTPNLDYYSVYARGGIEQTSNGGTSFEAGAAVGGPIKEGTLGFRLSASRRHEAGWVDHIAEYTGMMREKDANWSETDVVQLSLLYKPNDQLSIRPWVYHQNGFQNDTSVYAEWASVGKDFRQDNPLQQSSSDKFTLTGLEVTYDFPKATLISSTSFFDRDTENLYDATSLEFASQAGLYGPRPEQFRDAYAYGALSADQKNFTQEVRLQSANPESRVKWVVGAYYSRAEVDDFYSARNDWLLASVNHGRVANGQAPCASYQECYFGVTPYMGLYSLYLDTLMKDREVAVFGQADVKLTDRLTATVGLRYADTGYEATQFRAGTVIVSAGQTIELEQAENPLTPRLGFQYEVGKNNMVYGSAAKGYRAGGATNAVGARCAADADALGIDSGPRKIASDALWSYELGSKNTLMGGRLQLDSAVFHIDWTDIQSNVTLPCGVPTLLNMGDARSRGVELAAQFRATDDLLLSAAFGYTDSEYTTTIKGSGNNIVRSAGEPIATTPWSLYLGSHYNFELLGRNAYFRADYTYNAEEDAPLDYASYLTNPDIPRAEAFHNLDLKFAVNFKELEVAAFVQNALNQAPLLSRYEDQMPANYFRGATLRPRTIGVSLIYRY